MRLHALLIDGAADLPLLLHALRPEALHAIVEAIGPLIADAMEDAGIKSWENLFSAYTTLGVVRHEVPCRAADFLPTEPFSLDSNQERRNQTALESQFCKWTLGQMRETGGFEMLSDLLFAFGHIGRATDKLDADSDYFMILSTLLDYLPAFYKTYRDASPGLSPFFRRGAPSCCFLRTASNRCAAIIRSY